MSIGLQSRSVDGVLLVWMKKSSTQIEKLLTIQANQRCGEWYVPLSARNSVQAYFKSTDGHPRQHNFSHRRLNLGFLADAVKNEGILLVDSTRRGKQMPDALSRTVPIWCCVINRLHSEAWHDVCVPNDIVSAVEQSRMEAKIDQHVFQASKMIPLCLKKPLLPVWIVAPDQVDATRLEALRQDWTVVLCLSASEPVARDSVRDFGGYTYLQGAADDEETWALGLSSQDFWLNYERLRCASAAQIEDVLRSAAGPSKRPEANITISDDLTMIVTQKASVMLSSGKHSLVVGLPKQHNHFSRSIRAFLLHTLFPQLHAFINAVKEPINLYGPQVYALASVLLLLCLTHPSSDAKLSLSAQMAELTRRTNDAAQRFPRDFLKTVGIYIYRYNTPTIE